MIELRWAYKVNGKHIIAGGPVLQYRQQIEGDNCVIWTEWETVPTEYIQIEQEK